MMRGMNKRRKHSCVNTLNKSLLVNTFIGNLNMPSLEKVQLYGTSLSRNAIHTTTYHGAISISMYTHISRLNATPYTPECTCVYTLLFAHCFHLPWLTNPTIVRVEIWPLSAYPCAHAALDPCVSRSLRKSSVKTSLSTSTLTCLQSELL